MIQYNLFNLFVITIILPGLWLNLTPRLAGDVSSEDIPISELLAVKPGWPRTPDPPPAKLSRGPLPGSSPLTTISTSAAELISCYDYYFHAQPQINVGPDGNQKIFNLTPPTAGSPTIIEVTLPVLSLSNKEIARFYSDPPLAGDLHLLGDVTGFVWLQTTNFDGATFIAELFDYNPANGQKISLDELEFKLITNGQNETLLTLTPPPNTIIPAGHRLLFILYAKSPILTLNPPTVRLFYDSAERASHAEICQITPPLLTISKNGPVAAIAGQAITYTLAVTNSGGLTATNLLISDTVPAQATYLNGGTVTGNKVTWSIPSLAPGASLQRTFAVTATQTITNDDYQVKASNGISAIGQKRVVTVVSQPGEPNLFITKSAPATAGTGEIITYTLTIANNGDTGATDLLITDTLPAGANYIRGGTRSGNTITWAVNSLAAGKNVTVTFAVTATTSITNSNYRVEAKGQASAVGQEAVVTEITSQAILHKSYLPALIKSEKPTILIVQSINTGRIDPVRIFNNKQQEVLNCVVENNTTLTCGAFFVADGYYKIIAYTSRCGVLQGVFTDASPGGTITRQIVCN